jgi:SAM-dependent methyltransferase
LTSLLELGAGPAWHSREAAEQGVQCVALDANPAMRSHARDKINFLGDGTTRNIRVVAGDMRNIELEPMVMPEGGFDVATMLLGTAAHLLTYEDAVRCLKSVRKHIKVGGLFIAELEHPWDLFSGDLSEGNGDAWDRVDEDAGVKVIVEWGRDGDNFDIETQIYERTVSFTLCEYDPKEDGDGKDAKPKPPKILKTIEEVVPCKIFTQPEFNALARAAGLTCVAVYGDMDTRVALDDENAHNMVLVFRRDDDDT